MKGGGNPFARLSPGCRGFMNLMNVICNWARKWTRLCNLMLVKRRNCQPGRNAVSNAATIVGSVDDYSAKGNTMGRTGSATLRSTLVILTAPIVLAAQAERPVKEGDRVRVEASLGPLHPVTSIGIITRLTADSVFIEPSIPAPAALAVHDITSIEISAGTASDAIGGMKNGAIVGLGAGAFFALLATGGSSGGEWNGADLVNVLLHTTAVGATGGLLIGVFTRNERWMPGTLPSHMDERAVSIGWASSTVWPQGLHRTRRNRVR